MNARKKDSLKDLINRLHRLKGQLDAIERMIAAEEAPSNVLIQLQACKNALDSVKNRYIKDLILNSSLADIRESVDLIA